MDYFIDELLIPITEYEIFDPNTKRKLDLNDCSEISININIPVTIDEDHLYKYNPYSQYYTDKCYPYTSECGDDNVLIERRNEFNDNYLSLCENNCKFIEYDTNNKRVSCECKIKTNFNKLSELLNNKNSLLYHLPDLSEESSYENSETTVMNSETSILEISETTISENLETSEVIISEKSQNTEITTNLESSEIIISEKSQNLDISISEILESSEIIISEKSQNSNVSTSENSYNLNVKVCLFIEKHTKN